jgi:NADPH-dependent glutamate synthase beta subunit-like oxidoreductase
MVIKKTKKPGLGRLRTRPTVGGGSESSPNRPYHVVKVAPCRAGCPNETVVREILTTVQLAEKHGKSYEDACKEAWELFVERNPMPAVLGRVCPHPCESECNRKDKDGGVSINSVERFIGDYGLEQGFALPRVGDADRPEKIAVIGSGPAGLSCAYQLARRGYKVTIFEALPKTGGMLRYGIPDYRLPQEVLDKEIDRILKLGVELKTNTAVGRDVQYDDLKNNFDAIFVGIGAHKGYKLGVPGEDAPNVYTGTGFLNAFACGNPPDIGSKVIVIGGGDTAIDAARVARRLGAEARLLYRRTRTEMPAIEEEISGAEEEGVKIDYLVAPVEILIKDGRAVGMKCLRMELGEPDESGRRRPVPIKGSEFDVNATAIIPAISQEPDFTGLDHLREGRDWIKTDDKRNVTDNVYAGGDNINLGLVVDALFHGRMAAAAVHERFSGEAAPTFSREHVIRQDKVLMGYYESEPRNEKTDIPVAERFANPNKEISIGLTKEQFLEEVKRCMSCGMCFECGQCWTYCQDSAIIKPLLPGQKYKFKLEFCKGCDKCAENCPCGYIEMHNPASYNPQLTS